MAQNAFIHAAVAGYFGRGAPEGPLGVFRRAVTDGEWTHVLDQAAAQCVVAHPTNPEHVFAGTADGVWRSIDRGATWQRTNFPDRGREIWSIAFDPADPSLMYAGGSPPSVYRSTDSGAHWTQLPDPVLPNRAHMPFACRVMRFAPHPTRSGVLYATLEVNGVMRSDDGGEHWTDCSEDLLRLAQMPHLKSRIVSDTENEGMLDGHAIAISAADPDAVILAVRMGLFRSKDRGATWQDMEVRRFSPVTYARDIRVSPQDANTLYAALSVAAASTDGALFCSQDCGATWQRFDKVSVHGTVMSVALDPHDPGRVALAARYGEVFATQDGGETWHDMPLPAGVKDIYCLAVG